MLNQEHIKRALLRRDCVRHNVRLEVDYAKLVQQQPYIQALDSPDQCEAIFNFVTAAESPSLQGGEEPRKGTFTQDNFL